MDQAHNYNHDQHELVKVTAKHSHISTIAEMAHIHTSTSIPTNSKKEDTSVKKRGRWERKRGKGERKRKKMTTAWEQQRRSGQ